MEGSACARKVACLCEHFQIVVHVLRPAIELDPERIAIPVGDGAASSLDDGHKRHEVVRHKVGLGHHITASAREKAVCIRVAAIHGNLNRRRSDDEAHMHREGRFRELVFLLVIQFSGIILGTTPRSGSSKTDGSRLRCLEQST